MRGLRVEGVEGSGFEPWSQRNVQLSTSNGAACERDALLGGTNEHGRHTCRFWINALGCRVQVAGLGVLGVKRARQAHLPVWGLRCRVEGAECRVWVVGRCREADRVLRGHEVAA